LWLFRYKGRGFSDDGSPWNAPHIVPDILDDDECSYLIEKAEGSFSRSTVVGVTGPDASRTSETAWIQKDDPVARKVLERACSLTGQNMDNVEDLQVVRYRPGTFYNAHHDACCEEFVWRF
jgi:prolyl 4-hydroxylase